MTAASHSQLIGYETYHLETDVGPGTGSGTLGQPGTSNWVNVQDSNSCRPGPIVFDTGINETNGIFGFPNIPAVWRITVVLCHVIDIGFSNSRTVIVESNNGIGWAPEQVFTLTQSRSVIGPPALTGTSSGTSTTSFLVEGGDACKIRITFKLAAGSGDKINGGYANTNIQFELMYLV